MLLYIKKADEYSKNCLNIGLKFPDNLNNNYQETFIQQLKYKNIINKYFWTMILYNNSLKDNNYDGEFIFGDIIKEYYPKVYKDFSNEKLVYVYTGNVNKKTEENRGDSLEWGILFQIYYEFKENGEKKILL